LRHHTNYIVFDYVVGVVAQAASPPWYLRYGGYKSNLYVNIDT